MHITGIIAEYNPLHSGHQYHIEQTRALVGGDSNSHYIITVLSGDFVQRGLPAVVDKHTRTRMALEAGSDLVLELPVPYALSSGEGFGFGGVSLLHQLGCVDSLSFGTEEGELDKLLAIAKVLNFENGAVSLSHNPMSCHENMPCHETTPYQQAYQVALKQGLTHPAARLQALSAAYPDLDLSVLNGLSNNMLALEYCKALYSLASPIRPITVKRMGQGYLDNTFSALPERSSANKDNQNLNFASATAIREALKETDLSDADWANNILSCNVSPFVKGILTNAHTENRLIYPDDFSLLLHYKLLSLTRAELTDYLEISPDFANKICKNLSKFESFTQFANLLWTKDMTYARVCRNLMHIILDMKENTWNVHRPVPYARVLGFRKQAAPLLSEIKKKSTLPLITKLADANKILSPDAYRLLELDMKAAHIYDSVIQQKSQLKTVHEMQKQIVID